MDWFLCDRGLHHERVKYDELNILVQLSYLLGVTINKNLR